MKPQERSTHSAFKGARRSRLRLRVRATLGPLALVLGCLQAIPIVMNLVGLRAEGGLLGAASAFMRGANLVQLALTLGGSGLFVLAGAELLGPRPAQGRDVFTAGVIVDFAVWASLLRSSLYRSLLPWSLRALIFLGLLALAWAAFLLWGAFNDDAPPPTD